MYCFIKPITEARLAKDTKTGNYRAGAWGTRCEIYCERLFYIEYHQHFWVNVAPSEVVLKRLCFHFPNVPNYKKKPQNAYTKF